MATLISLILLRAEIIWGYRAAADYILQYDKYTSFKRLKTM